MRVDIWSDVVCPFCYIGKKRLEHVASDAGIELEIHWHSFELDPQAAEHDGRSNTERLAEKYGRSLSQMQQMERDVAAMAATEGIDFQWQKAQSGNTFNAHRLLHFAASKGLQSQLKEALCYAYMTEGKNIAQPEVLLAIAVGVGLPADEVSALLASAQYATAVRQDQQLAQQMKVSGVPFFVFDQQLALSGAQPREVMLQALQQAIAAHQEVAPAASCDAQGCAVAQDKD
jgi:predicted DsbA family dithiol-disulfide isomerase